MDREGDGDDQEEFSEEQLAYVRVLYHKELIPFMRRKWEEIA